MTGKDTGGPGGRANSKGAVQGVCPAPTSAVDIGEESVRWLHLHRGVQRFVHVPCSRPDASDGWQCNVGSQSVSQQTGS
jgi:hypothetical protein